MSYKYTTIPTRVRSYKYTTIPTRVRSYKYTTIPTRVKATNTQLYTYITSA